MSRAACVEIDLGAVERNFDRLQACAPTADVMAVVKADAYGHGLERVAQRLAAKAAAFGVASLADGERLRAVGIRQPIVALAGIDQAPDIETARRLAVDLVVHHQSQVVLLATATPAAPLRVYLKIDTGMHRLGFPADQVQAVHAQLRSLPAVGEIVLMSHLARSDDDDPAATAAQIARFDAATVGLGGRVSLANSAAVLRSPQACRDMIRPGGALYGLSPIARTPGVALGLEPAMRLVTRLIAVNDVAAGAAIGYGGSFTAPAPMRIGIAAIGYGDGYPRAAGDGTPVLVAGQLTRTVGRVSMDLLAVDVTPIGGADVGARVVLWGPELPIETIAAAAGTIGYELACGIQQRVAVRDF